ncbi:hypothetical protein BJF79_20995 [Actinomadura sp. CNU-125]|nr:hypothetical protein BJF79_20995 [Actinomadura sp. CNU-125]
MDDPQIPGWCPDASPATVTVTCRERNDDGGRMWFFGPGHEPIAEVDQIMNAVAWILGRLVAGREPQEAGEVSR